MVLLDSQCTNRSFHNFTDHEFTLEERRLLGLGVKFVPGSNTIPREELGIAFDVFSRRYQLRYYFGSDSLKSNAPAAHGVRNANPNFVPDLSRTVSKACLDNLNVTVRNKFVDKMDSYCREMSAGNPHLVSRSKKGKLKELRNLKDVVFRSSDKNLGLTAVNQEWYHQSCLNILNDPEVYEKYNGTVDDFVRIAKMEFDKIYITSGIQQIADFSRGMCNRVDRYKHTFKNAPIYFSEMPLKVLIESVMLNKSVPKFYGLPKIHKVPMKLRPIVASHSWISTTLGKFVSKELTTLTKQDPFICDSSRDFLRAIHKSGRFPPGSVLVTADVEALYPSIPNEEMIEYVTATLIELNQTYKVFTDENYIHFLVKFLKWIHEYHLLEYDGQLYRQLRGCAMGTNVSPVIANAFMRHFWKKARLAILADPALATFAWLFARNFLDDAFLVFPPEAVDHIDECFHIINSILPTINLTYKASLVQINYLDLQVYFSNSLKLNTRMYVKILNKFLYIPYSSAHPRYQLKAWIKAEILRRVANSSTVTDFRFSARLFIIKLRARGYPKQFLKNLLYNMEYYSTSYRNRLLKLDDKQRDSRASEKTKLNSNTVVLSVQTCTPICNQPYMVKRLLIEAFEETESELGPLALSRTNLVPMVALKKSKNIGNLLIRPKVDSNEVDECDEWGLDDWRRTHDTYVRPRLDCLEDWE